MCRENVEPRQISADPCANSRLKVRVLHGPLGLSGELVLRAKAVPRTPRRGIFDGLGDFTELHAASKKLNGECESVAPLQVPRSRSSNATAG
jgi:hypothetical protein